MPLIGEIAIFGGGFTPRNWLPCDGSLLLIAQNRDLFNVIGKNFGGDGIKSFALPNLRGRIPLHFGASPWLQTPRALGSTGGAEVVLLTEATMATHRHRLGAFAQAGTSNVPCGSSCSSGSTRDLQYKAPTDSVKPDVNMRAGLLGAGPWPPRDVEPHPNLSAALVVNFIICASKS